MSHSLYFLQTLIQLFNLLHAKLNKRIQTMSPNHSGVIQYVSILEPVWWPGSTIGQILVMGDSWGFSLSLLTLWWSQVNQYEKIRKYLEISIFSAPNSWKRMLGISLSEPDKLRSYSQHEGKVKNTSSKHYSFINGFLPKCWKCYFILNLQVQNR